MDRATPFPGLHSPGIGFEQPFAMLDACHDRVRRSLELLQRLLAHVDAHGADAQARDAARDVLRYFTLAAPAHHEDEERHVIPALRASGSTSAIALADRLLADHAEIRAAWQALQPLLDAIAAGSVPPAGALAAATQRFTAIHDTHLPLEDDDAFPRAAACLDALGAIRAMGDEMAARRGVTLRR